MRGHGCSIIDAPSELGLRPTGVRRLPDALRASGLLEGMPDVRYAGQLHVPRYSALRDESTGVLNVGGIRDFTRSLADRVGFTLDLGRFPVVLGGDCSILLGPALALRRSGRFGLLFIDGHADFYSPDAEPNGEAASMDLALVTGRGPAELTDIDGCRPLFRDTDVAVLGHRDTDAAAAYGSPDVGATAIRVSDLAAVRHAGASEAAAQTVAYLEATGSEGFWIHLDADVLHDDVMPAVDYRMPDGLWPSELSAILTAALRSPSAVGLDITIYNPVLDDPQRTAGRVLASAVTAAFAHVAVTEARSID